MSAKKLTSAIADKGWVLADGATGTNLFAMGLEAGEAPELWNEIAPDKIEKLSTQCLNAGSELILTNSFGCNSARLKLHNRANDAAKLAQISAEIAVEAAMSMGVEAIIAGSVGPTGELMQPMGDLTHSTAVEIFSEQIEGLKVGGVDLIWIETMSDLAEMKAAAEAAVQFGMDWCGTMSFDSVGRTMMGVSPATLASWVVELDNKPTALGANCGVGAADLVRSVLEISQVQLDIPIIAKANAGIPKFVGGCIHYDGTPELMADYAELVRNAGASIIGGCCGTGPVHLRKMRNRLESMTKNQQPELELITAKLGAFSGSTESEKGRRKTRRRK